MKTRNFRFLNPIFIATLSVFLSFFAHAEPPNLGLLKKELEVYYDSGRYQKELSSVIAQAEGYILQQATVNERHGSKKKLAIVLDIDETSISNYSKIVSRHFDIQPTQIIKDTLAADAPAIKSTLALYSTARKHGINVFFITGRPMSVLRATRINLLRAGYKHWAGLYLRPDNYKPISISTFKSQVRKSIIKQGYTIVASIGDQCSDLRGGYTQKGFKLPNPFYFIP